MENANLDFFELDKPVDQITLKELDQLAKDIAEQRNLIESIEETLGAAQLILEKMKSKMIAILEQFGKSSYPIPGGGGVSLVQRMSVALPKTPEEKSAFYTFLKERNIFDEMITVNSQTLNAFYKREFDQAAQEGRSIGFRIPGLPEHKIATTLSIRRGK